jgi:hypothetical protein
VRSRSAVYRPEPVTFSFPSGRMNVAALMVGAYDNARLSIQRPASRREEPCAGSIPAASIIPAICRVFSANRSEHFTGGTLSCRIQIRVAERSTSSGVSANWSMFQSVHVLGIAAVAVAIYGHRDLSDLERALEALARSRSDRSRS